MRTRTMRDLVDDELLSYAFTLVGNERYSTAALVACLAEIDRRRLYLGLGYSSMFTYCVEKLGLSGDAAYKRIQAARAARKSPLILHALRDGRLHLTAVVLLRPHLSTENAAELITAATHKTRWQVEEMLARRFPRRKSCRWSSRCLRRQPHLDPNWFQNQSMLDPNRAARLDSIEAVKRLLNTLRGRANLPWCTAMDWFRNQSSVGNWFRNQLCLSR